MNAPRRRTWLPDAAYDPGGLLRVEPNYHLKHGAGPWVLAGVAGGEVRITNGWVPPQAIKLYRCATLGQAGRLAAVVRLHARLTDDGYAWEVADVADHRPLSDVAGQRAALIRWARGLEPEITEALKLAGPGHYSLLARHADASMFEERNER